MIKAAQISDQINEIVDDRLSIDEFERWLRRESRNFHAYPDKQAVAAIFEIESVLSEYHAGLDDESTKRELKAVIRPFVRPVIWWQAVPSKPSVPIDRNELEWTSGNNSTRFPPGKETSKFPVWQVRV
jgi:hypothetical protein